MSLLISWLVNTLAVISTTYLLAGNVHLESFTTALVVALVLGIVNTVLKPLLILLTLPINIVTFGVFILVINAFLIMLTSFIVPGFIVDSFWWALLFGLVLSVTNSLLNKVFATK